MEMKFFAQTRRTSRAADRLRAHYQIERELADRLRNASRDERSRLYSSVYDELFQRVPDHPQLTKRADPTIRATEVAREIQLLEPFLTKETRFLEIGAGDCALSLALAPRVHRVWALDVSEAITRAASPPENFKLVLSDGCSIPIASNSLDMAYSNQLMEHLHPDDATAQLEEIARVLVPGGRYLCITPHRYSGPHDISKFYDSKATGLHLKEYTVRELGQLLRTAGFHSVQIVVRALGRRRVATSKLATTLEAALRPLPYRLRHRLALSPLRAILGLTVVATR